MLGGPTHILIWGSKIVKSPTRQEGTWSFGIKGGLKILGGGPTNPNDAMWWPAALQATTQVHKKFFISYVLPDQTWLCNKKRFLSYSKNYTCKFMLANSWHHKLFHFHLSFRIWKVWKGKKLQKFECLKNKTKWAF